MGTEENSPFRILLMADRSERLALPQHFKGLDIFRGSDVIQPARQNLKNGVLYEGWSSVSAEQIQPNAVRFYALFVVPSCTRQNPSVGGRPAKIASPAWGAEVVVVPKPWKIYEPRESA